LIASSEVASSPNTVPSVSARLGDGRRSAIATTKVAGDDEGVVDSWSQGVRNVWKETFHQIALWLNKQEPMALSASQSEPLLDLKTHDGAKAVQARLKSLGYYRYKVDGVWGPKSAAALSRFRRDAGFGSDNAWDLASESVLMGAND
jgi:hypothetical protein